MPMTIENVRTLIKWLGVEGARAGIEHSHLTNEDLRKLLASKSKTPPAKTSRDDLITKVLHLGENRIDKTTNELLSMSFDELLSYFRSAKPSRQELIRILGDLGFRPDADDQKSILKYAARQLSETGMFQRVAKNAPR